MHKSSTHGHSGPTEHEGRLAEPYWLSMMKLAAADWSMAKSDVACLLERNVSARNGRSLGIDTDDRVVLGLTV